MKNLQKGFINIIIAVVVVVAIAGYVAWDNNLIPKNILSGNNAQQDLQSNTNIQNQDNATLPVRSDLIPTPKPAEKNIPKTPVQSQISSNDSTRAGWVNYSNNTLGVGLKHPSDWNAYTSALIGANVIVRPKSSDLGGELDAFRIVITHEEGKPEEVLANGAGSRDYLNLKANIKKGISIDGRKTILRDIPEAFGGMRVETYIVDSGIGSYVITYFVTKTNGGNSYEQTAQTIIKDMHFDTNTLSKDPWVSKNTTMLNLFENVTAINSQASILYSFEKSYKQVCSGNMLNFALKTDKYQFPYFGGQTDYTGTTYLKPYGKSCASSDESFAVDFTINGRNICASSQGLDYRKQYTGYGHVDQVNKICIRE